MVVLPLICGAHQHSVLNGDYVISHALVQASVAVRFAVKPVLLLGTISRKSYDAFAQSQLSNYTSKLNRFINHMTN